MRRRRHHWREQGSIPALAFVALLPLVGAIGGFAVDCMHFNDEKGGLQRATDAGALAGAGVLSAWTSSMATSGTVDSGSTGPNPIDYALRCCKANPVDGRLVGTMADGSIAVQAQLNRSAGYTSTFPQYDQCQVDARMHIRSLFSMLFGNFGQDVNTHSIAGISGPIDTSVGNGAYPTALGWNDPQPVQSQGPPIVPYANSNGLSLSQQVPGNTYYWSYHYNAEWQFSNQVFNDHDVTQAQIAYGTPGVNGQAFNPGALNGTPPITVGQPLTTTNGQHGNDENQLAGLPPGTLLLIPIINSAAQHSTSIVIGFQLIKYQGAMNYPGANSVFYGILMPAINVPGVNLGGNGPPLTNTPLTVRLIQ